MAIFDSFLYVSQRVVTKELRVLAPKEKPMALSSWALFRHLPKGHIEGAADSKRKVPDVIQRLESGSNTGGPQKKG